MTTYAKRKFIIEQHEKKKLSIKISKMGKHLNLNTMFIKWTLDRYFKTKSIDDHSQSGHEVQKDH